MEFEVQKCRRINTTQNTDRGKLFTTKNKKDGFVEFESLGEEMLFLLLDHDPNCISIESQPVRIQKRPNEEIYYTPDAYAEFRSSIKYIFDVKHHIFFEEIAHDKEKRDLWEERTICIQEFCKKKGYLYQIVSDYELNSVRYENILYFRKNKRIPPDFEKIKEQIIQQYKSSVCKNRIELVNLVSEDLKMSKDQVLASIDHLILNDFFELNFELRITDDTILHPKSEIDITEIVPLFDYFNRKLKENKDKCSITPNTISDDSNLPLNASNNREFNTLSSDVQKIVQERIKSLEIFKKLQKSPLELTDYLITNKIHISTLYRWKRNFEQFGWIGLIPKHSKKGRIYGSEKDLEVLIEKILNEKYLTELEPSIKGCYKFLLLDCSKSNIHPCSYETFRRRANKITMKLKTSKRKGRKVEKDKFKGLNGVFPFGLHSLDIIEIDHSDLNVFVVDRIDRKVIGCPYITVAIDTYSRMIFGYYLSLDEPSSLSIGMCLLNGINKKDKITTRYKTKNCWPIHGIPKRILCDNGADFIGQFLLNFCQQYDIEMIFCPPKQPEKKPHIERFFRTLKGALKDDLIEGYRHPIEERRYNTGNPEKSAILTMDELENWIIHWLVDHYHQKIHSGIHEKEGVEISPIERFYEGTKKINGLTIGKPFLPQNLDQLRYDVLNFEKRKILRGGFHLFGLEYSSPLIHELLSKKIDPKKEYLIRYDPRDIREIYLWVEDENRYQSIPMKQTYFKRLNINPSDPYDTPLSEKELESIKKNCTHQFHLNPSVINDALENRQQIIENSRLKTKSAKSARKRQEKIQTHKEQATSTNIRCDLPENFPNSIQNSTDLFEPESDQSQKNKKVYPVKFNFDINDI